MTTTLRGAPGASETGTTESGKIGSGQYKLPIPRFPRLGVLDSVLDYVKPKYSRILEGFVVVAVQHLLETTGSMFESMFTLGLRPAHTFVLGKLYSNCRQVSQDLTASGVQVIPSRAPDRWGYYCARMQADVEALWEAALPVIRHEKTRGLIILDDGGYALASAPMNKLSQVPVCAVEQTSSGIWKMQTGNAPPVRVVQVAGSAAKTVLEPILISNAVLKRVQRLPVDYGKTYGVIGMGNIGTALAADLVRRGVRTIAYDTDPVNIPSVPDVIPASNLKDFFRSADVIFGCTGSDVLAGHTWWNCLEGDKIAASCSSHDQEFASVLRAYGQSHSVDMALRDVAVPLQSGAEFTILRGGFPVNFDNKRESVPANDIQMTRGLLLSGVIQAAHHVRSDSKDRLQVQLSPTLQEVVVDSWFKASPQRRSLYDPELPERFRDTDWIKTRSRGAPISPMRF